MPYSISRLAHVRSGGPGDQNPGQSYHRLATREKLIFFSVRLSFLFGQRGLRGVMVGSPGGPGGKNPGQCSHRLATRKKLQF